MLLRLLGRVRRCSGWDCPEFLGIAVTGPWEASRDSRVPALTWPPTGRREFRPRTLDTPRTPDHVAGFFAGFAAKPCFFAAAGQQKKYTVTRGF